MKIVFEKLQTSSKNVYVDFGNGTWQSFPVNEARTNGINIPTSCKDYSKIKIKGSAEIFPNMDVITGIKRYEKVGVDDIIVYCTINDKYELDGRLGTTSLSYYSDLYFCCDGEKSKFGNSIPIQPTDYEGWVASINDDEMILISESDSFLLNFNLGSDYITINDNKVDGYENVYVADDGSGNKILLDTSDFMQQIVFYPVEGQEDEYDISQNSLDHIHSLGLANPTFVHTGSGSDYLYQLGSGNVNIGGYYKDSYTWMSNADIKSRIEDYAYLDTGSGVYRKINIKLNIQ